MLEFREINIFDKKQIKDILKKSDFRGCEYSFANNIAWVRLANSRICIYNNMYTSRSDYENGGYTFTFPAGNGDIRQFILEMKKYAESENSPLRFWNISPEQELQLREMGFHFKVTVTEDSHDYVYLSEELISLKGRKFHQKRNHLKKTELYNWEYSVIDEKNIDECIVFCTSNYNYNMENANHSAIAEQYAINTYFNHFDELELSGGIIKCDGKIIALSIGEQLNSDTFCVHIEKADTGYQASYPLINREFARNSASAFRYINREEDMGIEGLRKAKRSYNPVFMVEKNFVEFY